MTPEEWQQTIDRRAAVLDTLRRAALPTDYQPLYYTPRYGLDGNMPLALTTEQIAALEGELAELDTAIAAAARTFQAASAKVDAMIAIIRAEDEDQPLLTAEGDIDLETLIGYAELAGDNEDIALAALSVAITEQGW